MINPEVRRNPALETLLQELRECLEPAEKLARSRWAGDPDQAPPIVFVHGAHRAGTTLVLQWLASTRRFAYPTNLLSRFFGTPIIGAQIQQLLSSPMYQFRDELADLDITGGFDSYNGKTRGLLAPNEFWYFWRRFLPDLGRDWYSPDELEQQGDLGGMQAELCALSGVFGQPFALKGLIMNQNIPELAERFPNAIFVDVVREPVFNIQSGLEARIRQHGDITEWYSFRIREYDELSEMDPLESVAGQIAAIRRSIDSGLASIPDERKVQVSYEAFCHDPQPYLEKLAAALEALGSDWSVREAERNGPFPCANEWRLTGYTRGQAEDAWNRSVSLRFG
jgi:hypothetical protein